MLCKGFPVLLALLAAPAAAQPARTLVIPDGNGVAIPARGAVPTVPLMAPRANRPRLSAADATPASNDTEWQRIGRLWPLIPLAIAGAVVAATVPGGGGGGAGAPAATR